MVGCAPCGVLGLDVRPHYDHAWRRITPPGAGGLDSDSERQEVLAHFAIPLANMGGTQVSAVRPLQVLRAPKSSGAEHPKRSPMPLCHASTGDLWLAFREGWRRFVGAYRAASAAFREGAFGTVLPDFCFRPWTPPL